MSSFPVTVKEVGYVFEDGSEYHRLEVIAAPRWIETSGGTIPMPEKLPQRLEPRAALSMKWTNVEPQLRGKRIKRAYAKTACGTTAHGRSTTLNVLARKLECGEEVTERIEGTP